eukprot:Rhum_TRINITY_DN13787_c0_g1::Rhum_TRINITY_DN13787_c0_g1_i1::g.64235::m.64235
MNLILADKGIIDLDIGRLVHTKEESAALSGVKHLNVSGNELTKVAGLLPLSALEHVNFSRNRIVSLSGLPHRLVSLDVSRNNLTSIEALSTLDCLKNLDVSHNKLNTLTGINPRAPLKVLKASYNLIGSLQGLRDVNPNTLRSVSVDSNYIKDPAELRTLMDFKHLVSLAVGSNPFTLLYPEFQREIAEAMPTLQSVDGCATARLICGGDALPQAPAPAVSPRHIVRPQPQPHQQPQPLQQPLPLPRGQQEAFASAISSMLGRSAVTAQPHASVSDAASFRSSQKQRLQELIETPRRLPPPSDASAPAAALPHQQSVLSFQPSHAAHSPSTSTSAFAAAPPQQPRSSRAESSVQGAADDDDEHRVRKRLEVQVEELRRLLSESQNKCVRLDRETARLSEEVSNCNRVITEQRKAAAELREENERLQRSSQAMHRRTEKVNREFKYAHQMNLALRQQLAEGPHQQLSTAAAAAGTGAGAAAAASGHAASFRGPAATSHLRSQTANARGGGETAPTTAYNTTVSHSYKNLDVQQAAALLAVPPPPTQRQTASRRHGSAGGGAAYNSSLLSHGSRAADSTVSGGSRRRAQTPPAKPASPAASGGGGGGGGSWNSGAPPVASNSLFGGVGGGGGGGAAAAVGSSSGGGSEAGERESLGPTPRSIGGLTALLQAVLDEPTRSVSAGGAERSGSVGSPQFRGGSPEFSAAPARTLTHTSPAKSAATEY